MKLKLYAIKGEWWLGYELNGHVYLLMYKGRVGDCIQP